MRASANEKSRRRVRSSRTAPRRTNVHTSTSAFEAGSTSKRRASACAEEAPHGGAQGMSGRRCPPRARGACLFWAHPARPALQEMLRVEGIELAEMNPAQVSSLAVSDNEV